MATANPHALDFLRDPAKRAVPGVCVLFGDEAFLKREVLAAVRQSVLGEGDGDFSFDAYLGDNAQLRDVLDALATLAMFGPDRRMVVIDQADGFVTRYRGQLESYAAQPSRHGVLVLDVKTWAKTTRLYKQVAKSGLQIECKTPKPAALAKWLVERTKTRHEATLEAGAAELMLELTDPDMGLLDQQLANLSHLSGAGRVVTADVVKRHVGSWRTRTAWQLIDAMVSGDAPEALGLLDQLLLAGEQPIAILAQMASTLRRFAMAARILVRPDGTTRQISMSQALKQAGFPPFVLGKAQGQLRHLGRERCWDLYRWLLDADLALKGESSAPPRARRVLERLIVRLALPAPQK